MKFRMIAASLAATVFVSSVSAAPNSDLAQARKQFEAGSYAAALGAFQTIVSQYPGTEEAGVAAYYIGLTHERSGRLREAANAYQGMLTSYPRSEVARYAGQRMKAVQDKLASGVQSQPPSVPVAPPSQPRDPGKSRIKDTGKGDPKPVVTAGIPARRPSDESTWPGSGREIPARSEPVTRTDNSRFPPFPAVETPWTGAVAASAPSSQMPPVPQSAQGPTIIEFPVAAMNQSRKKTGWADLGDPAWPGGAALIPQDGRTVIELPSAGADGYSSAASDELPTIALALSGPPSMKNVPSPFEAIAVDPGRDATSGGSKKEEGPERRKIDPSLFTIEVPATPASVFGSGTVGTARPIPAGEPQMDRLPVGDEASEAARAARPGPDSMGNISFSGRPAVAGGAASETERLLDQLDRATAELTNAPRGISVSGTEIMTSAPPVPSAVPDVDEILDLSGFTPVMPGPEHDLTEFELIPPPPPEPGRAVDIPFVAPFGAGAPASSTSRQPAVQAAPSSPVSPALTPSFGLSLDAFRQELKRELKLLPLEPPPTSAAPVSGGGAAVPAIAAPSAGWTPPEISIPSPSPASPWAPSVVSPGTPQRMPGASSPGDQFVIRAIEYRRGGMDDLAIAEYRKAIEADPMNTVARNNLADILVSRNERLDEAILLLNEAIGLNPPDKGPYYSTLGLAYARKGDLGRADQFITQALQSGVTAERLFRRGKVYEAMGLIAKARSDFDRALVYAEDMAMVTKIREAIGALEAGLAL